MQGKALDKKCGVFLRVAFSKTMYVKICDCREPWEESAKRDNSGVGDGDVGDMLDVWSGPDFVYFCKYRSGRVCG